VAIRKNSWCKWDGFFFEAKDQVLRLLSMKVSRSVERIYSLAFETAEADIGAPAIVGWHILAALFAQLCNLVNMI
jgi:hypothetical protein